MNGDENILLDNDYISRISKNSIKKVLKKAKSSHPGLDLDHAALSEEINAGASSNSISSSSSNINNGGNGGDCLLLGGGNLDDTETQEEPKEGQDGSVLDGDEACSSRKVKKLRIPDCSICREYLTRSLTVVTVCGHVFHKQCIDAWLSKCDANKNLSLAQGRLNYLLSDSGEPTCPLCRVPCSTLTLCDLVNITIDEALVLEDSDERLGRSQREEEGGDPSRSGGECIQIGCRLKLRSMAEELETRSRETEELRVQLGEEKKKLLLSSDLCESLERKNEVLREDLNRVTHELGEMNQRYSDLHRKYTLMQSNSAISSFVGEVLQEDPEPKGLAKDGQAAPGEQEDETSQISNLIGFNPFEGEDSAEKRDDAFQALKVLSGAFIKLSSRYDQLKEKSSKWKAKCYQLRDSHTTSINECNFLKEKLRSLSKTLRASETRRRPSILEPGASSVAGSLSATAPGDAEAEESFSYISKLIQEKKSRVLAEERVPGGGSVSSSSCLQPGPVPASPGRRSSPERARSPRRELQTRGSADQDSPDPNYSSIIKSKKSHVMKRTVPRDSQSISSFFYTRKPKLKLAD